MPVYLDDERLPASPSTLPEALALGQAAAGRAGRVVVAVTVGDRILGSDELVSPPSSDIAAVDVHLSTCEPHELVLTALVDLAQTLEPLTNQQIDLAHAIRKGQSPDAMQRVGDVLTAWGSLHTVLDQAASTLGCPVERLVETLVSCATPAPDLVASAHISPLKALAGGLAALKAPIASRDWIGLADTLEYDLAGLSRYWHTLLSQAGAPRDLGSLESPARPVASVA